MKRSSCEWPGEESGKWLQGEEGGRRSAARRPRSRSESGLRSHSPRRRLTVSALTNSATVSLSWTDDATPDAGGYSLARATGACPGASPDDLGIAPTAVLATDQPGDGVWCYAVTAPYGGTPVTDSKTVRVDTTPPTVSITQPASSLVSGTIAVTATASDTGGSGVGAPALTFTGPVSGSIGATWNTTSVPDGAYVIHADATDAAGNPGSATHPVTVDNTAPGKPQVHALQSPVAGSPTLSWIPVAGETYHVARTSSTPPGAKTFPGTVMPDWTDPDQLSPGTYTYVVTATDSAGNSAASATATVIVIPPGDTAPRAFSADSPTNAPPHLTWQPPVTFAVTSWQVYRSGQLVATLGAAASSFDDVAAPQGSNLYSVQAISSGVAGDMSSKVAVIYDTQAPTLGAVSATPNADGSVALTWPDAVDAGSGVASYIVRRGAQATAPGDPKAGTGDLCDHAAGSARMRRLGDAVRLDLWLRRLRLRRRRQRHAPDRDCSRAGHRAARPGHELPCLRRPDERAPHVESARPARLRRRRVPHHQAHQRRQATDQPARRHRGVPRARLPGQRLLRPEPEHRQEGDVRDLRARRRAELLGARRADGHTERDRSYEARPTDEGAHLARGRAHHDALGLAQEPRPQPLRRQPQQEGARQEPRRAADRVQGPQADRRRSRSTRGRPLTSTSSLSTSAATSRA